MNKKFFGLFLAVLAFVTNATPATERPAIFVYETNGIILIAIPTAERPCIFVYRAIKCGITLEKIIYADDQDSEGKTPLHHAAISGNIKITKKLLEIKADVESTDNTGKTPLFYAALHGKETGNNTCADFLIIKGNADMSVLQEETELQGWVTGTKQRLGLNDNQKQIEIGHCLGLCLFS
ncbi:ankyrin repeat domain-containing protein [bacterium]|nr:MAG: ankyrin repeat domain-containing protein [bacterium]